MPDRVLADLRLKVNGDLSRYRDTIRLQLKISKNEEASLSQQSRFRNHHNDQYHGYGVYDEDYYDEEPSDQDRSRYQRN